MQTLIELMMLVISYVEYQSSKGIRLVFYCLNVIILRILSQGQYWPWIVQGLYKNLINDDRHSFCNNVLSYIDTLVEMIVTTIKFSFK